jgi:hypothetical protein
MAKTTKKIKEVTKEDTFWNTAYILYSREKPLEFYHAKL